MAEVLIDRRLSYARMAGVAGLLTLLAGNTTESARLTSSRPVAAHPTFASLPVMFEPHDGQTDVGPSFLARGINYSLLIASSSATIALESPNRSSSAVRSQTKASATDPLIIRMQLVGARGEEPRGIRALDTRLSYFRGANPSAWQRDVPLFRAVRVDEVYEGIDIVYYGHEQQLEYDFHVAAGARPSDIRLRFEGATDLGVDETGNLIVRVREHLIRQHRPVVYQELDGIRREVEARYRLTPDEEVTFEIGTYDQRHPLVIDPILSYASYLGGAESDTASDVAIDADGFIYIAGTTSSLDFPGTVTPRTSTDIFVAKLNPAGSQAEWIVFVGGSEVDEGMSIALDASGFVYLSGATASTNFPTMNTAFTSYGGGERDGAIVKLQQTSGELVFSTYLGGGGRDEAFGLAAGANGRVYVSGGTDSVNFPTANAFQPATGGAWDAWLASIDTVTGALVYATYFGGSGDDNSFGIGDIAIDEVGSAYITGETESNNFPTATAVQPLFGGVSDAFVAKFDATGVRVYATYLGGAASDQGWGIAVDATGSAYVTGSVSSATFTTLNAAQPTCSLAGNNACNDAFAVKLSPAGNTRVYSTFLGGSDIDIGRTVAVDAGGIAYVAGSSSSTNFPLQAPTQLLNASAPLSKSLSNGASWNPSSVDLTGGGVSTLAIDPLVPATLYAGTLNNGVYKSTNAGASWTPINMGLTGSPVNGLVIDPLNPQNVYAATQFGGFFRSTNGGASWTVSNAGLSNTQGLSLAIDRLNPSTMYLATFNAGPVIGLYKSTNGGMTWAPSNAGLSGTVTTVAVDPTNSSVLYAGTGLAGSFKSTNGGANWAPMPELIGSVGEFAVLSSAPTTVYATSSAGLFRTTDGGVNWDEVNVPGLGGASGIALHPTNASILYVGAASVQLGVYMSGDGGVQWVPQSSGLTTARPQVIAVDPVTPSTVYVGADVGTDAFVTHISPTGQAFTFSTFLGGNGDDAVNALALDGPRGLVVVGSTSSDTLPAVAPIDLPHTPIRGVNDGFLARFMNDLEIISMLPSSGPTTGGTNLTLKGTFAPFTGVTVGGMPTTSTVLDVSTLVATTAPHSAGAVDVTVTNPRGQTITLPGAFTYVAPPASSTVDTDGDGMPDAWEVQYSLDPNSAADAPLDPDNDGGMNLEEYTAGTHPHGFFTRYFAEGATSAFFDTRFAILNPPGASAAVLLKANNMVPGPPISIFAGMSGMTRETIDAKTIPGLEDAQFSSVVESDLPVIADRTMTWDASGYGSHAETSIASPALTWYLAEGATHSGFDLFYLIQNANSTPATVEVTYLLPAPIPPVVKTYTVPAQSRFNIWVDKENLFLIDTDVSAVLTSTNGVPIIVERAMYLNSQDLQFGAGHESAAVREPGTHWFLAEGATGPYFDLFVLIANPGDTAAQVTATYLLPDGTTVNKPYVVAPHSRFNIWVDLEGPQLADTAVSTTIRSTNGVPIIVERAMWWPGSSTTWHEAHNSPGATTTGSTWAIAEGEVGGPRALETYILLANTSSFAGSVLVRLIFEDGTNAAHTYTVGAKSRFNVAVGLEFPEANGKRFGAIVESQGGLPAQLVVERAMYSNANGVVWAAGSNALATRLQ